MSSLGFLQTSELRTGTGLLKSGNRGARVRPALPGIWDGLSFLTLVECPIQCAPPSVHRPVEIAKKIIRETINGIAERGAECFACLLQELQFLRHGK